MEALREEIYDYTSDPAQESFRNQQYQRSSMQRSAIVDRLRREGCRINKTEKDHTGYYFAGRMYLL